MLTARRSRGVAARDARADPATMAQRDDGAHAFPRSAVGGGLAHAVDHATAAARRAPPWGAGAGWSEGVTPLPYSMSSVGFRPPSRAARGTADGPRRLHLPRRRRPRPVRGQGQVDPQARALLLPGAPAPRRGAVGDADERPHRAAPQDRRPGGADRAGGGVRHRHRERGPDPRGQPRRAPTGRRSTCACATTRATPTSGSASTRSTRGCTSPARATGATACTSAPSPTPTRCARRSRCSGKIFPSRPCEGREPGRPSGVPCLDYHIKRCLAPCVGYISKEDYRALIDQIIAFLSGRYRGLERELEEQMREAAAAQEFERAAAVRNRLTAVQHLMERQFATAGSVGTADVLGIAMEGDSANVQVLQVRDGVLQDRQSFFLDTAAADDEATVLMQFAYEFYAMALAIPGLVVVARDSLAAPDLESMLSERRGHARGGAGGGARRQAQAGRAGRAQRPLRARPGPPAPRARPRAPARRAGRPPGAPRAARAAGADRVLRHLEPGGDLRRRLDGGVRGRRPGQVPLPLVQRCATTAAPTTSRACARPCGGASPRLAGPEDDPSFAARPGLVVIDGGKGQLAAAIEGMREAGVDDVPVVSLAKRREEVFRPGRSDPLLLDEGSPALLVLQPRPRRGPPLRPAPPPRPARPGHDRERAGRPARGRARRARRPSCATSARPTASWPRRREEVEAVPGVPSKVARDIYDRLHKTARPGGRRDAGRSEPGEDAWS